MVECPRAPEIKDKREDDYCLHCEVMKLICERGEQYRICPSEVLVNLLQILVDFVVACPDPEARQLMVEQVPQVFTEKIQQEIAEYKSRGYYDKNLQ